MTVSKPGESEHQPAFVSALFSLGPSRKKRNLQWESALAECEIGDFLIVPLTTSQLLRAEGLAMRHCVTALFSSEPDNRSCHRPD